MRYALLLVTLSALVLAGCTSSRAGRFASVSACSPGTVVHESEVYAEGQTVPSDGEIIQVSDVYSEGQVVPSEGEIIYVSEMYSEPAPGGARTCTTFVPPPAPRLPGSATRAPTTCVPAARPAPVLKPAGGDCVGGNCGIPDPCDPCPGGNCGVPSLDACSPQVEFDPCKKR